MRRWYAVLLIVIALVVRSCGSPSAPVIEVNSTETHPGAAIRIDGWGFAGEAPFQVYLDGLNIANDTTNSAGGFHRIVTLSRRVPLGLRRLSVLCAGESAETNVDVVQWPAWISVTPGSLRPGEALSIRGGGFPPSAYYEIYIATTVLSGATDGAGRMAAQYTISKDTPVGSLVVEVNATMFSGPPSGMQSVEVVQWTPELEVSPSATNPGRMITIDGWGFPPMGLFRILWDGSEVLVGTSDRSGHLSVNYILPCDTSIGQHAVAGQATEFAGPPSAATQVDVVQWPVELDCQPPDGHPGSGVAFLGRNFPPRTPFYVSFDGVPIASGNTTEDGELSASLMLPANLSLGYHEAIASVVGYAGPPRAGCRLNVAQWPLALSVSPPEVHPGSSILILGFGFPPNAPFEIQLDSLPSTLTGSSNGSGFIQSPYQLSRSSSLGEHCLVCTVKGYSGPPRKVLIFDVTQWPVTTRVLPIALHPGSAVHVVGEGCPPAEVYTILVDGAQMGKGIVDQDGTFNASCVLQRDISLGTHQLRVETSMLELPPVDSTFLVGQWPTSLRLSPSSGPSGTILSLNGSGYPPGSQVLVFFDGYCMKAAESTEDGDFAVKTVVTARQDESYHLLRAVATGGYTGDPQCVAYFWLGTRPPGMVAFACDKDGSERRDFFTGEVVNVAGSGYPPSVAMRAYILSGPALTPASAMASQDVRSDERGNVVPSRIAAIQTPGICRIWMDVNLNGIHDSNDVLGREEIAILHRPDLALGGLWLSVQEAVQGQIVSIRVNMSNQGNVGSEGTLVMAHGDREVAVIPTGTIQPGATKVVNLDWDTSAFPPGTDALAVKIQQLPGETDIEDNYMEQRDFTIKPRPDISVSWLAPDSREVHKGKVVAVRVGLRNNGASSQAFSVHLLWGTQSIVDVVVNLAAGLARGLLFEWDTSDARAGTETLGCTAEVLLYERSPADNAIVNGTLTIQPPNRRPIADPHGPYQGELNKAVTFDGTWSYDADGTVVLYRWDFGDGSFDYGGRVQHAYARAGSYDVALTVTDDDGETGAGTATASVGPRTEVHHITVRILDAIKLSPVSGAFVEMAEASYESSTEPLFFEVRGGTWALTVSRAGYLTVRQTVIVGGDLSLAVEIMPIVQLFPCDALGRQRSDYASGETVYAGLSAPDQYGVRIYVVGDGSATEGKALEDVTSDGSEFLTSTNGTVVTAVWPHPIPGSYDLVLDVDGNGVFAADRDVLESPYQPGFRIAETGWIVMLICVLALVRLGIDR